MTQHIEKPASVPPAAVPPDSLHPDRSQQDPSGAATSWWRRPWILPLMLVTALYLYLQVKPFAPLDEATAPMPPHAGFALYYPVLLTHISGGTIALITVCFQVWPRLRNAYPKVHRVTGRVYVVAAVVTGACGLIMVRFAPPVGQIGVSVVTLLWVGATLTGFYWARRGNWVLHRRFMLYSFALVINNFWGQALFHLVLLTNLSIGISYFLEISRWLGWIVNLILMQWWLSHTEGRPLVLPSRRRRRLGEVVSTGS